MLSLPDFTEKKIIIVEGSSDFSSSIRLFNSNLVLLKDGKRTEQVPFHLIFCLFIIGDATLTTKLIEECQKFGISICLLNKSLKAYSQISAVAGGNYLVRQKQYTMGKDLELELSKKIVTNKINNQRFLLKMQKGDLFSDRQYPMPGIDKTNSIQDLLGIEGMFAKNYFSSLFCDLSWIRRAPRTKEDINNALLDIGYTLVFNYVDAILNIFGFDTYKGFYHQLYFQRKSLSCDLMEPIRPLVDKGLCKAYNLKRINEKDFKFTNGQFEFKSFEIRKKYLSFWLDQVMNQKEQIYKYIQGFYHHLMNPEKYHYLPYKIT